MSNSIIAQPQNACRINRSHPLAANILEIIVGNNPKSLLLGLSPTTDTSTKRTDLGNVCRAYSSQQTIYPNSQAKNALSFLVVISVDALTNYGGVVACQDTASTNGYEFRLGAGATDSKLDVVKANSGTWQWQASSSTNQLSAGDKNVAIVINLYSDLGTAVEYFFNGKKVTASTLGTPTGSGAMVASTNSLYLGSRPDGVTKLAGSISLFVPFNRTLTDAEAFNLMNNPWKVLADSSRLPIYMLPLGGSTSAALSASGVGVASFAGQSLSASTLSGAGVGVATLTGKSLFNSTLSGSGVGVGSFTGASLSASTLSGAGIGVGSFLGASLSTSTLSSSGLGVASLAGKSLFNSTLTAAGLGLSSFVGASTSSGSAVLSAAGVGLGSFTGQSLAASTMAGAGAGLATLTGASLSNSTLSSVGIGVASFVSPSSSNSFTASGLATVNFTGSARASSTLTATGLSIVNFGSPFTAIIADPKYTIYSHTRDYKSSSQKRNYNIER